MGNRRGQSVAEYAVVLSLVVVAVVAMQVYVTRSFKAKIKDSTDLAVGHVNTFIAGENDAPTPTGQYEPYYVDTDYKVTQDRDIQETVSHDTGVASKILTEKTTRKGAATTGVDTGADDGWQ